MHISFSFFSFVFFFSFLFVPTATPVYRYETEGRGKRSTRSERLSFPPSHSSSSTTSHNKQTFFFFNCFSFLSTRKSGNHFLLSSFPPFAHFTYLPFHTLFFLTSLKALIRFCLFIDIFIYSLIDIDAAPYANHAKNVLAVKFKSTKQNSPIT